MINLDKAKSALKFVQDKVYENDGSINSRSQDGKEIANIYALVSIAESLERIAKVLEEE